MTDLLCPARVAAVWRSRGGEDQAGGGHFLQQPALCPGDHQDQAEERLSVYFLHPGTRALLHILQNVYLIIYLYLGKCSEDVTKMEQDKWPWDPFKGNYTSSNQSLWQYVPFAQTLFKAKKGKKKNKRTVAWWPSNLFYSVAFQEAESNRLCRRLQLKDIIPVEMLRLTKYPLLLENIAKYTGTVLDAQTPRRGVIRSAFYVNAVTSHGSRRDV